ncbi:spectinomycin phosphotransferase [Streptoalloteichus tenebrarius]|uniref:Spectinomycin phosphotransferase n=1 Tax=Streptoalloteichus tenebrarius (strain ATCC 17920 / DSM 40477 / JCM 4838 / CBS 697.72 / NBRC 16177 / NCIMB 11028 / NRRL B-12390 / A12253. 1 / ISP 5477) TaxID=1933 RepID=A0ABT1HLQ6_STRSD|nr:phosphotransferase [Streptoalloteichus tenebrarius]MCP2256444.1 spectinomycin phosphotransferase [Streptoalloteichus tenebrarius]BFF04795.1 aminoglycoside O-phosphotransferase APH(9)-Ia [Streptoalloteichus tenebrarius]
MRDRLRAWVREDFDVDLVAMARVDDGADVAAEVWRGETADGASYAVKWSGGGSPAGLALPAWLAENAVPGIVAPMRARHGALWSEREGRRLSLVPWVSDVGALDRGLSARQWTAYGELMARVHATHVTSAVSEFLPREVDAHERWVADVHALDGRLREPAATTSPDPLVRALVEEWRAATELVSALVGATRVLSRDAAVRNPPEVVVCHGDPHLGNLLVGDDERVWLIDWDDAVLAPRERDLLFVLGGVLDFAPVGEREQSWFLAGYGPVDVDPVRLAYHRCVRALEDLVVPAAQVVEPDRHQDQERAEALSIFRGVLSPTGLARRAFASLRDLGLRPPGADEAR